MKKILPLILFLALGGQAFAADTKLTALTADASPTTDDLLYTVNDPGGTPASRKATIANVLTLKTLSVREFWWPASATLPLEAADSIPPIAKDTGTNVDVLAVDFDASTDECRMAHFKVPSDVKSGSTVTFRIVWYSTATSGDVIWDARYQSTGADNESWDQTLTTKAASAATVKGTTKLRTVTTWTETLANLGWAANDDINISFCRDANNGSDTMAADARVIGFGVEIPRA